VKLSLQLVKVCNSWSDSHSESVKILITVSYESFLCICCVKILIAVGYESTIEFVVWMASSFASESKVWDWSTNDQCNRPSIQFDFAETVKYCAHFKYCSLIMCKADDERARIHIHPTSLIVAHGMEGLNTDSRLFTAKHFKLSSQFECFPHHTHFFPVSCEMRFSFSKTSSRSHCEIMLSNVNQLRPGVANFKSSSWQHHMTNASNDAHTLTILTKMCLPLNLNFLKTVESATLDLNAMEWSSPCPLCTREPAQLPLAEDWRYLLEKQQVM
jgi:hypothetical protein